MKSPLLLPLLLAVSGSACRSAERVDEPLVVSTRPEDEPTGSEGSLGARTRTRTLFQSPRLSAHATEAAGPIAAHYHADHEETVYVISGRARMRLGEDWHELKPGDLIHIPRGVVHEVELAEPVSVLSLFAPPFHGRDRVFVDESSEAAPVRTASSSADGFGEATRAREAGFLFLPDYSQLDLRRGLLRDS